jgi:hypothetical protein
MIADLYMLQHFFEEAGAAMYQEDVVRRYGRAQLKAALEAGLIEARCLPCRGGGERALFRLSEKGMRQAAQLLAF